MNGINSPQKKSNGVPILLSFILINNIRILINGIELSGFER